MSAQNKRLALIVLSLLILASQVDARQPRSAAERSAFIRDNPCPATHSTNPRLKCLGYVVDHIKPLACGGEDAPHNMQWQTTQEARAKDKWERGDCNL